MATKQYGISKRVDTLVDFFFRLESLEVEHKYVFTWLSTKTQRQFNWEKKSFQQMVMKQLAIYMPKKYECWSIPHNILKLNENASLI